MKKESKKGDIFDINKLTKGQKEFIVNKYLSEMYQKDLKSVKRSSEIAIRKVKVNIPAIIKDIYHKDENIFVLELEKNYALLIKRKEETVTRVLCPGTMSPVEQQKDVTIFDFFVLWWDSEKKPIKKLGPIEEYGIPIFHVETEYDVKKCIDDL